MKRYLLALLVLAAGAWGSETYQCAVLQASFPNDSTLVIPKGTRTLPCSMHVATVAPRPVLLKVTANMTEMEQDSGVTYSNSVEVATLASKMVSGAADEVLQANIPLENIDNCRELHIGAVLSIPDSDYVLAKADLSCRVIASVSSLGPPPNAGGGDMETVLRPATVKPGTTDLVEGLPIFDIGWHMTGSSPGYLMFKLDGGPQLTADNLQMSKGTPIVEIPVPPGGGRFHVDVKELLGAGAGWTQPMILSSALLDADGSPLSPEQLLYHIDPGGAAAPGDIAPTPAPPTSPAPK